MSKVKTKVDVEWAAISDAFCEAQVAAADAFAALEEFDSKAPATGGQKAYNKWRDANDDVRSELEYATLDAARDYVAAHEAELRYFERGERDQQVGKVIL
jgi:hypothetical protein